MNPCRDPACVCPLRDAARRSAVRPFRRAGDVLCPRRTCVTPSIRLVLCRGVTWRRWGAMGAGMCITVRVEIDLDTTTLNRVPARCFRHMRAYYGCLLLSARRRRGHSIPFHSIPAFNWTSWTSPSSPFPPAIRLSTRTPLHHVLFRIRRRPARTQE